MTARPHRPVPFGRPDRLGLVAASALIAAVAMMVLQSAAVTDATYRTTPSAPTDPVAPAATLPVPSSPVRPSIGIIFPHPAWLNVTNSTSGDAPPAGHGSAAAYDPIDNETVSFGGCPSVGACPDNQTWVFANGVWTNVTEAADAPPAVVYPAMDFDVNMGAILLYGGCLDQNCSIASNATWTFSNGTWTNVSYFGPAPPALGGAGLAFDPEPEENGSVLFGGCVAGFLGLLFCDNETWVWQAYGGWVNLTPSVVPPSRGFAQMAYDPSDEAVVLFGGLQVLTIYSDTWELYSGQWWNVTPKVSPAGRTYGGMVELPDDSGVMMFGGLNESGDFVADSWTYYDGVWEEDAPTAVPPARGLFSMALDGTGSTVIIEGGENNTVAFGDTWAYEFPPYVSLSPNVASSEVGQKATFNVTASAGTSPYRIEVAFGDGAFAYPAGEGPYFNVSHAYETAGTYNLSVYLTDAVGATASAVNISFTVTAGPSVSAKAVPGASDVGYPVSFVSTVLRDGALPLNYTWDFGDHTASGYGATASHTYAAAGTFTAKLKVRDADGVTNSSSFSITVAPVPTITVATTSKSPSIGSLPTFFANVSNGTGPYTYDWLFGDGSRSALPTPQHAYARSGSYEVRVWVNDSVGASAYRALNVTVPGAASGGLASLGGAPAWFWGGIGAVGAAGAAGSVLLLRRGRAAKP